MRLPRRVPWASLAELDILVGWIYAVPNDAVALQSAVNRLAAWRAITPLSHSLEATHSLLAAILLDSYHSSILSSSEFTHHAPPSVISIRQSYAAACIRLVNGLVDPLQFGAYARSIASIAAQIGLPLHLVELRHAATHEDLPSLESLRAATHEALDWLLNNYFLPTLSASVAPHQSTHALTLHPVNLLLKQYKVLLKKITRDASLRDRSKDDVSRAVRAIERWICEAKVAASATSLVGWGGVPDGTDDNCGAERWALERLCDGLLSRGGIVPVSRKKRLNSQHRGLPVLPSWLVAIWSPLFSFVTEAHPALPTVLVSAIMDNLLNQAFAPHYNPISSLPRKDASSELCLAAWASWCVDQWDNASEGACTTGNMAFKTTTSYVSALHRDEVVIGLIKTLAIPSTDVGDSDFRGANALLSLLVDGHPRLKEKADTLFATARRTFSNMNSSADVNDVSIMEERLRTLISAPSNSSTAVEQSSGMGVDVGTYASADDYGDAPSTLTKGSNEDMPYGWSYLSARSLRGTSPIGVHVRC